MPLAWSVCKVGDLGSTPGIGRSPGEGNGNALQYSCLENPMDREAWWVTVHGVARVRHDLVTKPSRGVEGSKTIPGFLTYLTGQMEDLYIEL